MASKVKKEEGLKESIGSMTSNSTEAQQPCLSRKKREERSERIWKKEEETESGEEKSCSAEADETRKAGLNTTFVNDEMVPMARYHSFGQKVPDFQLYCPCMCTSS